MAQWGERGSAAAVDTIFALATPPGRSAVAVIRLSGPQSEAALLALTGRRWFGPRLATLSRLRDPDSGETLDQALALWFPAPASFSGEDCAELHLHGSVAAVRGVTNALSRLPGLREARPGEFARRAFANGKLDLRQVEALADLIDAQTARQRRLALRAIEGVDTRLERWREAIFDALAEVESQLDFSDEGDVGARVSSSLSTALDTLAADIRSQVAQGERATKIQSGFVVALCGSPNAGKSTLLNALAGHERAIVSPIAGTTRDTIEATLELDGLHVTLCDTAGIRETAEPVERIGVDRATAAARRADLTLWLSPADAPDRPPPDFAEATIVISKSDLASAPPKSLAFSARTGVGLDGLVRLIAEAASSGSVEEASALTSARMVALGRDLEADVVEAACHLRRDRLELAAAHLNGALVTLVAMGSKSAKANVLDAIFSRFCIGK